MEDYIFCAQLLQRITEEAVRGHVCQSKFRRVTQPTNLAKPQLTCHLLGTCELLPSSTFFTFKHTLTSFSIRMERDHEEKYQYPRTQSTNQRSPYEPRPILSWKDVIATFKAFDIAAGNSVDALSIDNIERQHCHRTQVFLGPGFRDDRRGCLFESCKHELNTCQNFVLDPLKFAKWISVLVGEGEDRVVVTTHTPMKGLVLAVGGGGGKAG